MDLTINRPPAWHSLGSIEALKELTSDVSSGLTPVEASSRLLQYGANELAEVRRETLVEVFIRQFKSPLIYLLLGAALIALLLSELSDALVILVVVLMNSLIGAIQEQRAAQSLESLKSISKKMVKVLRAKTEVIIEAKHLVPGDILLLSAGDAVAADARLLSAHEMKVAEAALTGESLPVDKDSHPGPIETQLADRRNMVFSGTYINAGRGVALVVATGPRTEVGKIAKLATEESEPPTPLEQKVAQFGRLIMYAAGVVFGLIIAVGLWQGLNLAQIFMVGISQIVSMIPEGLPVAITIALAVGVKRMADRGAIVRKLAAVETLGSTSVICTDKTGTLTKNEMTVCEIVLPRGLAARASVFVSGVGYEPVGGFSHTSGEEIDVAGDVELRKLLIASALCNDARLVPPSHQKSEWSILGDPTEAALLTLAHKGGLTKESLELEYPRNNEVPFDSSIKMMATEHHMDGQPTVIIKGAPESVLKMLPERNLALEMAGALADRALRVLAFVELRGVTLEKCHDLGKLKGDFRFLGLVGQMDPPRQEVLGAVQECEAAGIRAVMVTGDHKKTGYAIGKMLGFIRPGDRAVDGAELDNMSDSELDADLGKISVFARVRPEQKLRIVQAFQRSSKVVAMTGDGVNDAPALVRADVGIAMGITGTDTAKEASKIILTDDNFTTIVQAVRQGRLVYRNVKKLILFLFSTGLSEIIVLFGALLFGYPPPLAAVQILWINLVTDGALTVTLIMEPEEGDEMKHQPIPRSEPLITRAMGSRMLILPPAIAISTLGYFVYGINSGRPFVEVQTATFTVLAVSQWFNALNCRSFTQSVFKMSLLKNKWLIGGLLAGNFLQASVIFLPFMNSIFHTQPIPLKEVFIIGAVASLVLWVEELRKFIARRSSS